MGFLDTALRLAERGFYVFPLVENSKLPLIEQWQIRATRDPEQIRRWWVDPVTEWEQPCNIGICTTFFEGDRALLVIDVDNKNGKNGDAELASLRELPATYEQQTPTGGRHLVYWVAKPVKQGVGVLGPGLDIRSRGGYIAASGSVTAKGAYTDNAAPVAEAPQWLIDACGLAPEREAPQAAAVENIDPDRALIRAERIIDAAPIPNEGERNATAYKLANRIKDVGVGPLDAGLLMAEWNEKLPLPLADAEIEQVVRSAYRYGLNPQGASAPEAVFSEVQHTEQKSTIAEHPFEKINREYAFVLAGGGHHILWETADTDGKFKLEHLAEQSFHRVHAANVMAVGEKVEPVTKLWMTSPDRRSYRGICFKPGEPTPPDWYNLWRGFAVEPARPGEVLPREAHAALEAWLIHARDNVCRGNVELTQYLIGWFAHLIQRPWEKPHVALVLYGDKGVGKNALIDMGPGRLLGAHCSTVAHPRYLTSNFNGHLENQLLFVLDEAFWSGDKSTDGIVKDLITGTKRKIEHKGKEPYDVDDKCRVVIMGNEEHLVNASDGERRYAVFNVGNGRQQDVEFFTNMRLGMAAGGSRLLLRYLMDYDIGWFSPYVAPMTEALAVQKRESLDPFSQWWYECLSEGRIVCSDLDATWPEYVDKSRLRSAFLRYIRERNIKSRVPNEDQIGRALSRFSGKQVVPGRRRDGDARIYTYKLLPLNEMRASWSQFIGHADQWE